MGDDDRERGGMTRRRFAALAAGGCAAAAVGAGREASAADADWPNEAAAAAFRARSAELTGFAADELDAGLARALLRAFVADGRGDELRRLLSAPDGAPDSALAADIASAWYSGVHPGPDGPVVATFNDALAWPALGFAGPPGVCSAPGSWAGRPAD